MESTKKRSRTRRAQFLVATASLVALNVAVGFSQPHLLALSLPLIFAVGTIALLVRLKHRQLEDQEKLHDKLSKLAEAVEQMKETPTSRSMRPSNPPGLHGRN